MSSVFHEVLSELGIKQLKSSANHPHYQGSLERYHQTFKNMIRLTAKISQKIWTKEFPFCFFCNEEPNKKRNDVNYVISTPDQRKSHRVCNFNMLKKYHERDNSGRPVWVAVIEAKPEAKPDSLRHNSFNEYLKTKTSILEFVVVQLFR